MRYAYGPETLRLVGEGDTTALLRALAALVSQWKHVGGHAPGARLGGAEIAAFGASPLGGVMAAALDLQQLLAKSPQGRQALRDLGLEPVLQHVEGE